MLIDLSIAPSHGTVNDYAEDAVRNAQQILNIRLDYSLRSLELVDFMLLEWKREGATPDRATKSLYALGSYAGEVLRNLEPGRWTSPEPDGDSPFLFVRLLDGREWKPIDIVFRALLDGPVNGLRESAGELVGQPLPRKAVDETALLQRTETFWAPCSGVRVRNFRVTEVKDGEFEYEYELQMLKDGHLLSEQECPNNLKLLIEALAHQDLSGLKEGECVEFCQRGKI